jgi:hypothetical protein
LFEAFALMSFALGSPQKCNALFQPDSVMQNIDEDVERMNFKLISVENSIRKMLAERQLTVNESHGSLLAKLAKSRHETEAVAAKLLLSRQNQQDKRIRLRLKRYMEQESILINDVAVPDLKLSDKSAALVNASQKKMFEKKIQLVKLCNELKTMNLQSVILANLNRTTLILPLICLILGCQRNKKRQGQGQIH